MWICARRNSPASCKDLAEVFRRLRQEPGIPAGRRIARAWRYPRDRRDRRRQRRGRRERRLSRRAVFPTGQPRLWPLAEFDCENEQDLYRACSAGLDPAHCARMHAGGGRARFRRADARALRGAAGQGCRGRCIRATHGVRPSVDAERRTCASTWWCAKARRSCRSISAVVPCIDAVAQLARRSAAEGKPCCGHADPRRLAEDCMPKAVRCSTRCAAAARC